MWSVPLTWRALALHRASFTAWNVYSSFKLHLHNGDPLTARTVNVPKGRPKTGQPPFAWGISAKDFA